MFNKAKMAIQPVPVVWARVMHLRKLTMSCLVGEPTWDHQPCRIYVCHMIVAHLSVRSKVVKFKIALFQILQIEISSAVPCFFQFDTSHNCTEFQSSSVLPHHITISWPNRSVAIKCYKCQHPWNKMVSEACPPKTGRTMKNTNMATTDGNHMKN